MNEKPVPTLTWVDVTSCGFLLVMQALILAGALYGLMSVWMPRPFSDAWVTAASIVTLRYVMLYNFVNPFAVRASRGGSE